MDDHELIFFVVNVHTTVLHYKHTQHIVYLSFINLFLTETFLKYLHVNGTTRKTRAMLATILFKLFDSKQ